jgi:hypothetical protein
MLFKNFYNNHDQFRLNEGNFISKDFTGLFDTDAKFRLTELNIDKLFEGLDLEKSEQLHSFIKTNMPNLAPNLGKAKASTTSAFDLIASQISYIQTKILLLEKELAAGFEEVKLATKTSYAERSKKISAITSPSGVTSIIPKIDEAVKNFMKSSKMDFKSDAIKQDFISLYEFDISEKTIKPTLQNLKRSSDTDGLKDIYTKIDDMDLEKIEADTASLYPKLLVASTLELNELLKSTDIFDRLAAFYEMVLTRFNYGQQLTRIFGKNYTSINIVGNNVGPDVISTMEQFMPNIARSNFEPMSELLNEVSSILLKRVFLQSPDEDLKNIFTPSLQVMYMCMLSIVSLKLINLNLEVESLTTQKEVEIKKTKDEQEYNILRNKSMRITGIVEKMDQLGFLTTDKLVYKTGSQKMNPEVVKLINNFLVYLKDLPNSKINSEVFDTITEQGIKSFQTKAGTRLVDGKVGRETKSKMKEVGTLFREKYAQGPKSSVGQTSSMDTSVEDYTSSK